jgi:hypothetical protein
MKTLLAVILLLASFGAHATSQIPDALVVDGKEHELHSQPFAALLRDNPSLEESLSNYPRGKCSASWFGYKATWEISDGTLYLTELISNPCSDSPPSVPLNLLPGYADGKVPAKWFTGRLVVPLGEMFEYIHMGFDSKYERYLVFSVEDGAITAQVEQSDHPGRNP